MPVPLTPTVRRLGRIVELTPRRVGETDLDLLAAFRDRHDQAAFAELVRRHGALVRAVCRRVLGPHPAVDDAWQATFLVLARRAAGLVRVGSLAGWLHGVAYRTALNARRADRRRAAHEANARTTPAVPPDKPAIWRELQELVDTEARRLPAPVREVFVRCCLEDAGCHEVARELGLNEGTVRSRLARARRLLRGRLERRGVCLSALVALTTVAADPVPAAVAGRTAEAAVRLANGQSLAGLVSPNALAMAGRTGAALARRVAVAVVIAAGLVGVTLAQLPAGPADPPPAVADRAAADAEALPAHALARFGTTRFRAGAEVVALSFSPDGRRLASWGRLSHVGDRFHLWDAATGREVRTEPARGHEFLGFGWTGDGRGLAVLRKDPNFAGKELTAGGLELREFTADKPAGFAAPTAGNVRAFVVPGNGPGGETTYDTVALAADGRRLAATTSSVGKPGPVELYEAKPAAALKDLKKLAPYDAPPLQCGAIRFTPDGKHLVGVGRDDQQKEPAAKVVVWGADGKVARTIATAAVTAQGDRLTFAVSDAAAAIGLADGDVELVDLATGTRRAVATGHKGGTYAVAFSPDGRTLVSTGRDGHVRASDAAAGKVLRVLGKHFSWPESIAFSPDGKRVASSGQDGVIRVWDTAGGEAVPTGGHAYGVWGADVSADGKTVLTDARDRFLRLWDPATGAERRRIEVARGVLHARLSPDGRRVVAVVGDWNSPEKSLRVWDAVTGADATPPGFPKGLAASGFRFTPDGATLLTHHEDRLSAYAWPDGARAWDVEMPKPVNAPGINRVDSIAVSPDGRHFVTVAGRYWYREERGLRFGYGADGVVDLFETATGARVRRLVEAQQCFRAGTFTADGLFVHNGGGTLPNDGRGGQPRVTTAKLCVIDPLTGRLVREFGDSGRPDSIDSGYTVALSADGKVLFKATGIGEVQAFEVATGKFRTAFVGHRDYVFSLATPTDVRRLLSGSKDTTALLWDVGFVGKPGAKSTPLARGQLWETLRTEDGKASFDAMTALAGDPAGFVELAAAELKPAKPGPSAADLAPIFRDLDAKAFARREAATAKLNAYGESALARVRAELEKGPSAEVRERLERFIAGRDGPDAEPDRLRASRAIELLEHLGTPEARALLTKLAAGGPARRTTDAAGALKRLAGR